MQRQAALREQSRQPARSADEIVMTGRLRTMHGATASIARALVRRSLYPGVRALESATRFLIYSWRYGLIRPCAYVSPTRRRHLLLARSYLMFEVSLAGIKTGCMCVRTWRATCQSDGRFQSTAIRLS
jgi:hypothetical protein